MGILQYTNGLGHLIMSVLFAVIGTLLILFSKDAAVQGMGVTLVLTVSGAWFIPGAAKQVAYQVTQQSQSQPLQPPEKGQA